MSNTADNLPLRRNKKPQSCEPCRLAKIACDHGLPTCQRCVRRSKVDQCVYIMFPQTKVGQKRKSENISHDRDSLPALTRARTSPDNASSVLDEPTTTINTVDGGGSVVLSVPSAIQSSAASAASRAIVYDGFKGSVGPTHFSSIFKDHEPEMREDAIFDDHLVHGQTASSQTNPDPRRIRLLERLLRFVPTAAISSDLIERYFAVSHPLEPILCEPIVRTIAIRAHILFPAAEVHSLADSHIPNIVTLINTNQTEALTQSEVQNVHQWPDAYSGQKLRWETMALLSAMYGLAAVTFSEWDTFWKNLPQGSDRKGFMQAMLACSSHCLRIVEGTHEVNDVLVHAQYLDGALQDMVGDDEPLAWKKCRNMANTIVAMGMGQQRVESSSPTEFLFTQLRIRTFAAVFNLDKHVSSFNGRPPAMSRIYFSLLLPLDVSDDDLLQGCDFSYSKVNDTGWNISGSFHDITMYRIAAMFSCIRDEMLQLSLGALAGDVAQHVRRLTQLCNDAWQKVPLRLKGTTVQDGDLPKHVMHRVLRILDYQYLIFSLARLLPLETEEKRQQLLGSAHVILDPLLDMWARRDYLIDFQWQFDMIIICYGIQSAGVLSMELLRRSRNDHSEANDIMPRFDTIQKLFVFLSLLDWMKITSWCKLSAQMHKILKHILDRVLSRTSTTEKPGAAGHAANLDVDMRTQPGMTGPSLGADLETATSIGFSDADMFNWPVMYDVTQAPWLPQIEDMQF